jgi:hypothetical protein
MSGSEIPQYSSSEESAADVLEESEPKKRRKKVDKQWKREQVFSNKALAQKSVKNEGIWSFYHKNVDTEGNVSAIYRCNKVKYRGEQCASGVYLYYPANTDNVVLYRSELLHTCESIPSKTTIKISGHTKSVINTLFENDPKLKPKKILEILAKKHLPIPKKQQLNNYLASLRTSKFGPNSISLGELEQFCIDHSPVPENKDEAFIISHQMDYGDPPSFRFFMLTKNLIRQSQNACHVDADATYKLICIGFPLLVFGTTDKARSFHIFGVAVCANEQTENFIFAFKALKTGAEKVLGETFNPSILICDAAQSIQNGFKNVFGPNVTIKMCWAHMKRSVRKKADQLVRPKANIHTILEDIDCLQLSKSQEKFDRASIMFLSKWEEQKDFLRYFESPRGF